MAGHRPFSELLAKMSPKAQEKIKRGSAKILAEMELADLREALSVRQIELAERLQTTQAAVSRLERRGNVTLASLNDYVEALGGKLELSAVLPGRTVKIVYAFRASADRSGTITLSSKKKGAGMTGRKRKVSQPHSPRAKVRN